MYCYKLTIAYDGTHYSGWQMQPNALSVQQVLQEVVQKLLKGQSVPVVGSGRTDAGVHARGQIAHFKWSEKLDLDKLLFSLNGLLPRDIRVSKVEEALTHFHAQYDASGKEYHYYLYTDKVMDPFRRSQCWHLHRGLDRALLNQAAELFVGKHDFTSFANERASGNVSRNPVRTIYRLDIIEVEGGLRLEFEGDGFLYKMVRNIVGAVVAVASGRITFDDLKRIFEVKDRGLAPMAAPAQGLFLVRVHYGPKTKWRSRDAQASKGQHDRIGED